MENKKRPENENVRKSADESTASVSGEGRERAKMSAAQRAKQFMPFSAVTGLDRALRKKEQEMEESGAGRTDNGMIE